MAKRNGFLESLISTVSGVTLIAIGSLFALAKCEPAQRVVADGGCASLALTGTVIQASNPRYYDKGIINDYRQLTDVTVTNTSTVCAVRSAEGDVTWFDAHGQRIGSAAFAIHGSVA